MPDALQQKYSPTDLVSYAQLVSLPGVEKMNEVPIDESAKGCLLSVPDIYGRSRQTEGAVSLQNVATIFLS
jgi:hypothetical protein